MDPNLANKLMNLLLQLPWQAKGGRLHLEPENREEEDSPAGIEFHLHVDGIGRALGNLMQGGDVYERESAREWNNIATRALEMTDDVTWEAFFPVLNLYLMRTDLWRQHVRNTAYELTTRLQGADTYRELYTQLNPEVGW